MKTSCILALAGGCLACTVAAAAAQNGSRTIPRTGVPPGSHGSDDVPMADAAFEDFIVDAMKEWNLPGLSIAIVDGNKTWAKVRFAPSHKRPPRREPARRGRVRHLVAHVVEPAPSLTG